MSATLTFKVSHPASAKPKGVPLLLCWQTHPRQPHRRAFYVSSLPGHDGKDWGYTLKPEGETRFDPVFQDWVQLDKALFLSPYWVRRFRRDCERTSMTFHSSKI